MQVRITNSGLVAEAEVMQYLAPVAEKLAPGALVQFQEGRKKKEAKVLCQYSNGNIEALSAGKKISLKKTENGWRIIK